jgi:hypothetical protein
MSTENRFHGSAIELIYFIAGDSLGRRRQRQASRFLEVMPSEASTEQYLAPPGETSGFFSIYHFAEFNISAHLQHPIKKKADARRNPNTDRSRCYEIFPDWIIQYYDSVTSPLLNP